MSSVCCLCVANSLQLPLPFSSTYLLGSGLLSSFVAQLVQLSLHWLPTCLHYTSPFIVRGCLYILVCFYFLSQLTDSITSRLMQNIIDSATQVENLLIRENNSILPYFLFPLLQKTQCVFTQKVLQLQTPWEFQAQWNFTQALLPQKKAWDCMGGL